MKILEGLKLCDHNGMRCLYYCVLGIANSSGDR